MQIESGFLPRFLISQNPKVCQNAPIIKDKVIRANWHTFDKTRLLDTICGIIKSQGWGKQPRPWKKKRRQAGKPNKPSIERNTMKQNVKMNYAQVKNYLELLVLFWLKKIQKLLMKLLWNINLMVMFWFNVLRIIFLILLFL